MSATTEAEAPDAWAEWLRVRRDGDDAGTRARHGEELAALRDGVLERAAIRPGDTVLDVGCGTGMIGLGALDRVGPDGRVIFSDVSAAVLGDCRAATGGDARCTFVEAAAERLAGVGDASVDRVVVRSVLMYSDRKPVAITEFFRVLRPGGRVTIFEPINQFAVRHGPILPFGLAGTPVDDLLLAIGEGFRAGGAQGRAYTQIEFDERDLMMLLIAVGFTAVEVDFRAQYRVPAGPLDDWEALKQVAPNPLAPTFGEVIAATLTESDQARLDAFMTSAVAARRATVRTQAVAYLSAVRPA